MRLGYRKITTGGGQFIVKVRREDTQEEEEKKEEEESKQVEPKDLFYDMNEYVESVIELEPISKNEIDEISESITNVL